MALDRTLTQARISLRDEQPLQAERLAGDILKIVPGHLEAVKVIGYALIMQNRYDEAATALEKAARSSRDPEIETALAIALRHTGKLDKALVWLKRAVTRSPPFPAAFHELGFVYNFLKRPDEAIAILKQGIEVAPMLAEMSVQLGDLYYRTYDNANAEAMYRRALAINPRNFEALQGLGTVLMHARDYAKAAELFRGAIANDPADVPSRIGLGNCLLHLGDEKTAYACLRAVSARGPKFHGKALKISVAAARGRFWLRPSAAAKFFKGDRG